MDDALASATTLVTAHGGKVLQYAGDNLLAVFGADEAREDDVERAVRCGLALLELGKAARHGGQGSARARRLQRARRNPHRHVLLGGGVDGDGNVRGIAVNVAARMEQTAPAGHLRISHDTYCAGARRLRGRTAAADWRSRASSQPVAAYLVLRARPRGFRLQNRGIEGVADADGRTRRRTSPLQRAFLSMHASGDSPSSLPPSPSWPTPASARAGCSTSSGLDDARPESFLAVSAAAPAQPQASPTACFATCLPGAYKSATAILRSWPVKGSRGVGALFLTTTVPISKAMPTAGPPDRHSTGATARTCGHPARPDADSHRGFHAAAQLFRRMSDRDALPVVLSSTTCTGPTTGRLTSSSYLIRINHDMPLLVREPSRDRPVRTPAGLV